MSMRNPFSGATCFIATEARAKKKWFWRSNFYHTDAHGEKSGKLLSPGNPHTRRLISGKRSSTAMHVRSGKSARVASSVVKVERANKNIRG